MQINLKVKKGLRIRAFQLFFLIIGLQIGVGFLGLPRYIFEDAKQDAWISIIFAAAFMFIVIAIMFHILRQYENADIFGIQVDLFGKWFGKLLGLFYIIFFFAELLSVLLKYIEIVQVFLFPTIPTLMMGLILLTLVVYSVFGGIRVVVGVVFFFVFLSPWIFILLYDPVTRIETAHFFPMFDASIMDLLKGGKTTAYSFLGIEILFILYPFIEDKENAKRPFCLGAATSAFIVLLTTIISIGYYSPNDFERIEWPVLSLFKSVSFSFMERFDYFVIVEWIMVIIPTMVLLMWAITHGTKRLFAIPQKTTLYVSSVLLLLISLFINSNFQIQLLIDSVSKIGLWLVFVYPFLLYPLVLIKKKRRKRKEAQNEQAN